MVVYTLLKKHAFAVLKCQKNGPSDQSEMTQDQSWPQGAHVCLQWSKNPPFMTGLGWWQEGVWSCFIQMTASSDCRNRSGSNGPSMSLLESYVGLALCPTSKNLIPRPASWLILPQVFQRRPSVRGALRKFSLTRSASGN